MRRVIKICLACGSEKHTKLGSVAVEVDIDGDTTGFEQLQLTEADMEWGGLAVAVSVLDDDYVHSSGQGGGVELESRRDCGEELPDVGRHDNKVEKRA